MSLSFLADKPCPAVIAMLHVPALPGTPRAALSMHDICDHVRREAAVYAEHGVDAVMLENMHDVPYLKATAGPEITACMTAAALAAREAFAGPMGVQVLAGANHAALAVALAAALQFVRVEGFVFGHVADEGWLDACAGELLRLRRHLGCDHVAVLADLKKKHAAHAATADVSLAETVRAAAFCGADGVIVTGEATGQITAPDAVHEALDAAALPVLVGSGVTVENLPAYARAHGVIVGSYLKARGVWAGPVEAGRVEQLMAAVHAMR